MNDEVREEHICCAKLGRPRSEAAQQAILGAARDLLLQHGYADVTVEAIAAHAGVSKATIYRWWPGKAAVVLEAFLATTGPSPRRPDTACPAADLREQLRGLAHALAGPVGIVLRGVLAEAQSDPEVAETLRVQYLAPRRAETCRLLERARAAGRISADADVETAADTLVGPLFYRLMTGHAPPDAAFADTLVTLLFDGLHPCPAPKNK